MKNITILGKGYIGNNLFKVLKRTFNVSIFNKEILDYTNRDTFKTFLDYQRPNIVINCVGYTGRPNVDACESELVKGDCLYLNGVLPQQIGQACKNVGSSFIHISSGCIYQGYDKPHTEEDVPNFGMFSNVSSFYSKSKHLGEVNLSAIGYGNIFRIRMPFCSTKSERSIISKIQKYPMLMSRINSMTCVEDLCNFTSTFIERDLEKSNETYNVVNRGISCNKTIVDLLRKYNKAQQEWEFVEEFQLKLRAVRSNCVLSPAKIGKLDLSLPHVNDSLENCIQIL